MARPFLNPNSSHSSGADSARADDAPETPLNALPRFMSVRQVADYLHLNEKKVYALASEGKIPATKVTGKWLFPRHLIDEWMLASSHGGVLTDRIALVGSDDPLIWRAVMSMANEIQGQALLSYSCTGTQLGLNLLARQRADVCALHWGPAEESIHRHPALIRQYPQHHNWVVVRVFYREQGLICAPGLAAETSAGVERVFQPDVRWAMRQEGAGSQRFLKEIVAKHHIDPAGLRVTARAFSEREAASLIAMDHAEVAPGVRAAAIEFGLDFVPIGWEAYDFALNRGIYFRNLFQKLMDHLKGPECQRYAQLLSGYDFKDSGRLIWSE
jgi:excisionase family DNA binding protein